MKEYRENGKVIDIILDNGKIIKVSSDWVEKSMKALSTDKEDIILMYLEDNGYLENEEQNELDKVAKANKPKIEAKAKTERKKVVRERKPNPTKEMIISKVAELLDTFATDVNVENVGKIITFKVENKQFKLDLTEKRAKKV